jgi:hypothetical protein
MKKIGWLMTASLAVAFLGGAAWYVVSVEKRLAHSFRMVGVMADYQRYADKMRFAGAAENWELARWYLWKLGTASWVVTDGLVEEYRGVEDYDVVELTQSMLWPALERLESAIEAKDPESFQSAYQVLINTCNACHHATRHGFVNIVEADIPTHRNQQYSR